MIIGNGIIEEFYFSILIMLTSLTKNRVFSMLHTPSPLS